MRPLLILALLAGCSTKAVVDTGFVPETGDPETGGDETGSVDDSDTGGGDTEDTGGEDTGGTDTAETGGEETGGADTAETGGEETGGEETGGEDTEEPDDISEFDGLYTGEFSVSVTVYGLGDTCSGEADFAIVDGAIAGTVSCEFAEGGAASWAGLDDMYTGDLEGTVASRRDVSGTITISIGEEFSDDWSGAISGSTLDGAFDGTYEYSGFSLSYDGSFSASSR